jgi:hypothetical protein
MLVFSFSIAYNCIIEVKQKEQTKMEIKKLFTANNETHAKATVASLARKGTKAGYDKNTFTVYLVRASQPKTENAIMYIKGEKKSYYRG